MHGRSRRPGADTGRMARPKRAAVAVLGGLSLLSACTIGGNADKPTSHWTTTTAATLSSTPATKLAPSAHNRPAAEFHPVGTQVSEAAHLRKFLAAYNAGQLTTALAQFSRAQQLGFSDCDYQTRQLIAGHGRAALGSWLQTNIAHHDRLIGANIFSASPGQPVLGVSFHRRSSDVLARAGHPDGITPALAAKVKFDRSGRITEFNNGPGGGPPDACQTK